MHTTLALDDDVTVVLPAGSRLCRRPVRVVTNDTLRRRLAGRLDGRNERLTLQVCCLGDLKPRLSVDSIAKLIEQVESPLHR